jgi:hypothetical protein
MVAIRVLLLNDEGLVWSSIAANPALRKFRCVQPSRDGLRPDSDPLRDGQLSVTLTVQFDDRQVSLVSRLPAVVRYLNLKIAKLALVYFT